MGRWSLLGILDKFKEEIFDIFACFCRDFEVRDVQRCRFLLTFFFLDFPVLEVYLVANEEDKPIAILIFVKKVDPHFSLAKAGS